MLFTLNEIIDLGIMVVAIGYIFSSFIPRKPKIDYDPLAYFKKNSIIEEIKQGALIAAPAVVLHELSHKFTAMAFGAAATLHAPLGWYAAAIAMKLLNSPFLFLVGGYVSHSPLPPLESAVVSISGPLINLLMFFGFKAVINFKMVDKKHYEMIGIAARLNLFLFGFNMIPIPGFDGYHFFTSIIRVVMPFFTGA